MEINEVRPFKRDLGVRQVRPLSPRRKSEACWEWAEKALSMDMEGVMNLLLSEIDLSCSQPHDASPGWTMQLISRR